MHTTNKWFLGIFIVVIIIGTGFVFWQKSQVAKPTLPLIMPLQSSKVNILKTYRSETHGFSIQYPSGWTVAPQANDSSNILINNQDNPDFTLMEIHAEKTEKTANDYIQSLRDKKIIFDEPEQMKFGQESAIKLANLQSVNGYTSDSYLVSKNGNIYSIGLVTTSGEGVVTTQEIATKYLSDMEKILGTIEFFTPTEAILNVSIDGWKTYTSSTYKFSMKYPENYTYAETKNPSQLFNNSSSAALEIAFTDDSDKTKSINMVIDLTAPNLLDAPDGVDTVSYESTKLGEQVVDDYTTKDGRHEYYLSGITSSYIGVFGSDVSLQPILQTMVSTFSLSR